jgi:hypothetical protein
VNDKEVDDLLNVARGSDGPDTEVLAHITASVQASLKPVRPLPSRRMLTALLFLLISAFAILSAARVGFSGMEQMVPWQRMLIFPALAIFMFMAAVEFVSAMIPGSRRRISSGMLATVAVVALLAVFALSFRDYETTHFVSAGLACLIRGLLHAIPAALLGWLLLRRGFAVRPVSAGLAIGALSGLAGLAVLELNCTNFQAAHVLVWHTAVVAVSAITGALAGYLAHWIGRLRA